MAIHIQQYPNLELSEELIDALRSKNVPEKVRLKVLEAFLALNDHGTDKNYLKPDIEKTYRGKILEMKFKGPSKTEWRILFKRISKNENPPKYGLMNLFKKDTEKLRKQDLDAAERIAKREGW